MHRIKCALAAIIGCDYSVLPHLYDTWQQQSTPKQQQQQQACFWANDENTLVERAQRRLWMRSCVANDVTLYVSSSDDERLNERTKSRRASARFQSAVTHSSGSVSIWEIHTFLGCLVFSGASIGRAMGRSPPPYKKANCRKIFLNVSENKSSNRKLFLILFVSSVYYVE